MNRFLVVLPNWYGETLFATPFLRALRHARPDAFIATLGWPQCREVLLHNPDVNLTLDYDERGAHHGLTAKWRLIGELRRRRFDAWFMLRKSLSRSLLLALTGVSTRVGFDNPKSGWLLTHRLPPSATLQHKAATYLPLLSPLGITASLEPYQYIVSEEERQAAREWLQSKGLLDGRPVIVLHPGANWPHKRWAPEHFAALGDRLADTHQAHLVISGGPNDTALTNTIISKMRYPSTVMTGQTTFRQLGACLEQATLLVSNDTGALHLAAALGRPLVALYGPTAPTLTGPLGDSTRIVVIHHQHGCPRVPCYAPDQPPHAGMSAITVDEVSEAVSRLLAQKVGHV